MARAVTYTHYGTFGLCPVLIARPLSDDPDLRPRYPFTGWLFWLSVGLYNAASDALEVTGEEPSGFPIKVKGRLNESLSFQEEDES